MSSSVGAEQRVTYHTTGDEASRLYVKKTIVVGNVSKYVAKHSTSHSVSFFLAQGLIQNVLVTTYLGRGCLGHIYHEVDA